MNIAILHFHLNRGGVTSAIANHLRSLDQAATSADPYRVAILHGGRRAGWENDLATSLNRVRISLHAIDGLDYDDNVTEAHPTELARQLRDELDLIGFAAEDTILHVHNHALGKNVSLPGALNGLAQSGYRLLLHVHDFAEDFRPRLYQRMSDALGDDVASRNLYPLASQVHYAVLNRRDDRILLAAGIPAERVHFLPNPVVTFGELPEPTAARDKLAAKTGIASNRRYVLYPVRGIRRKNLGELLLWSAAAGDDAAFGITLPATSAAEQSSYDRWKQLAEQLQLRCYFEVGEQLDFTENLAAADAIISTSVAEGFGLVFLEAWLASRPLVGRNLPEITADFVENGLQLDWMSQQMVVPTDWFDIERVGDAVVSAYEDSASAYGRRELSAAELRQQFTQVVQDGGVDFAVLPPSFQRDVVRQVQVDSAKRQQLRDLNPHVDAALNLDPTCTRAIIEQNAKVVRDNYSPEVCGQRLLTIYESVIQSEPSAISTADGGAILDRFLDICRFHALRTET
jgi:glycosyltransferase involved in cell wall biosynthesis